MTQEHSYLVGDYNEGTFSWREWETEDVQKLADFLCSEEIALTPQKSFNVIYYLQEKLHIIPDNYEICDECLQIFNFSEGGVIVDEDYIKECKEQEDREIDESYHDRRFCDWCRP